MAKEQQTEGQAQGLTLEVADASEELIREATEATEERAKGIKAGEIDQAFVPKVRDDVAGVELDGELVLLIEATSQIINLDPMGTIVFKCIDGTSAVGEIAEDIADAFQADPEVILEDVLKLTKRMGRAGLLTGVDPEPEVAERVTGLDVGTQLPSFRLSDTDGAPVAFEDLRGQTLLLINWSASCGFCRKIAGELGELEPGLQGQGVRLMFLARGDQAGLRSLHEESSLTSPILLQEEVTVEFFQGIGTPAAYLVDENGEVAKEMALGADEVSILARIAAGRDAEAQEGERSEGTVAGPSGGDQTRP
jgi:peroxiredoxin